MSEKMKILVTGACGVTSRSVVRSLKRSDIFKNQCEFIGTDVCCNLYGAFEGLYNKIYHVPWSNDEKYREIMASIIVQEKIDAAIIIPEPEVYYWSEHPFDVKFMRIPPKFAWIALSKRRLYETLYGTGLVPDFQIVDKIDILNNHNKVQLPYPFWVRDYSEGTTSGKGSFAPNNYEELKAWFTINPKIKTFMLSTYLSGRNLGCFLLYSNGKLLKQGVAERIDYLMGKVAVSGITGNTCKGKLLNYPKAISIARQAIETVFSQTGETLNGLMVTDIKEDASGTSFVTEINIRPVAFTSTFAAAGFNFAEYQLLCVLGREHELTPEIEKEFPPNNLMLRDVDGLPIYVENFKELEMGKFYKQN
jgi:carbamoyl-phosphate synthase large subunit